MRIEVITPPATALLSLDETRQFLGETGSDHDRLIGELIDEAHQRLDGPRGELGRCILPQTLELHLPGLDAGWIRLRCGPVTALVQATYETPAGVTVPLPHGGIARQGPLDYLTPPAGGWPTDVRPPGPNAWENVHIRYEAGDAEVPGPVRAAARMMVMGAYDYRSEQVSGGHAEVRINRQVDRLLADYRLSGHV